MRGPLPVGPEQSGPKTDTPAEEDLASLAGASGSRIFNIR